MYIRAHQNNTIGKIQFFRYDFDYAARDCETNEIISLSDNRSNLPGFTQLEFLDWKTGKSKYDFYGRRI